MQKCIHNTVNFLKWCKTNIFMYILYLYYNLPFLVHDVAFRQMWTSQPCEPDYTGQWLGTETLLGTRVYPSELRWSMVDLVSKPLHLQEKAIYVYKYFAYKVCLMSNIAEILDNSKSKAPFVLLYFEQTVISFRLGCTKVQVTRFARVWLTHFC